MIPPLNRLLTDVSFIKKETKLSSGQASQYNVSQRWNNHFGYNLVRSDKLNDAVKIFELNVVLFPKSADVYDSFGETLISLGRVDEGVNAYEKALTLDPQYENASYAVGVIEKHNVSK